MERTDEELRELQAFVIGLGAAMNATGAPVDTVQARLARAASAYGARDASISAFPTYLMVTMGRGESATLELTTVLGASPVGARTFPASPGTAPSATATSRIPCRARS